MAIAVISARFEVRGLRARVIRLLKIHTQDAFVKMENYDQRVTIFFALCPLPYDIILGVVRKGIDGLRRRLGGETSGEERELLKTSSCHTACAFGRKGRSGKLQKELAEMNRKTTTLCVMAAWAIATLVLPTPSYSTTAFQNM